MDCQRCGLCCRFSKVVVMQREFFHVWDWICAFVGDSTSSCSNVGPHCLQTLSSACIQIFTCRFLASDMHLAVAKWWSVFMSANSGSAAAQSYVYHGMVMPSRAASAWAQILRALSLRFVFRVDGFFRNDSVRNIALLGCCLAHHDFLLISMAALTTCHQEMFRLWACLSVRTRIGMRAGALSIGLRNAWWRGLWWAWSAQRRPERWDPRCWTDALLPHCETILVAFGQNVGVPTCEHLLGRGQHGERISEYVAAAA